MESSYIHAHVDNFSALDMLADTAMAVAEAEEVIKNTPSVQTDLHPLMDRGCFLRICLISKSPFHVPKRRRTHGYLRSDAKLKCRKHPSSTTAMKPVVFDINMKKVKKHIKAENTKKSAVRKHVNLKSPVMPETFMNKIKELNGSDIKFLIEKKLTKTDVGETWKRLSMPVSQIQAKFLKDEENAYLGGTKSINVLLIEPSLDVTKDVPLKKWNSGTLGYVLASDPWFKVVQENELKQGDCVQVWSFRSEHKICFALVKLMSKQVA